MCVKLKLGHLIVLINVRTTRQIYIFSDTVLCIAMQAREYVNCICNRRVLVRDGLELKSCFWLHGMDLCYSSNNCEEKNSFLCGMSRCFSQMDI